MQCSRHEVAASRESEDGSLDEIAQVGIAEGIDVHHPARVADPGEKVGNFTTAMHSRIHHDVTLADVQDVEIFRTVEKIAQPIPPQLDAFRFQHGEKTYLTLSISEQGEAFGETGLLVGIRNAVKGLVS